MKTRLHLQLPLVREHASNPRKGRVHVLSFVLHRVFTSTIVNHGINLMERTRQEYNDAQKTLNSTLRGKIFAEQLAHWTSFLPHRHSARRQNVELLWSTQAWNFNQDAG